MPKKLGRKGPATKIVLRSHTEENSSEDGTDNSKFSQLKANENVRHENQ